MTKFSQRNNSRAELMQLLHTTASQLQLQRLSKTPRCEVKHSKICPSLFITFAWLKWTRLFLLCYGRLCCCCCCSYCCRCSPSGCLAATEFQTVVWFGFYTLAEKQRAMCNARRVEQDCACVCCSRLIFIDFWYFAAFTLNQYFNY